VFSTLLRTVRRSRHVKLATSPTQRHCTIEIGRRNQMTSVIKISLEINLQLAATAQPSATSLKPETYQSTWVYYQFSCFIRMIQPRRLKFMRCWTMLVAGRLLVRSRQRHSVEGSDTDLVLTTIHGTCDVTTKAIEELVVANIKEENVMLALLRACSELHTKYHSSRLQRDTAT